jgi:formate-dependent nitrite reductase membrane component NrfD
MLFYFHAGDAPLWAIILWLIVIPTLLVCLLIYIERKYKEKTRNYKKNANPLSLNTESDKENQ